MDKEFLTDLRALAAPVAVRLDEPMARHTTFGIGGPADCYAVAATEDHLLSLTDIARRHDVPVFVLGSGSNILVGDGGFRACFQGADELLIAETYAAREEPSAGMSARELADLLENPPARYVGSLTEAPAAVLATLRPGDVFFTIGAGNVDEVGPKVLEGLKQGQWTKSS